MKWRPTMPELKQIRALPASSHIAARFQAMPPPTGIQCQKKEGSGGEE